VVGCWLAQLPGDEGAIVGIGSDDLAGNRPGDAVRRKLAELEPNRVKRMLARWSNDPDVRSWASGLVGERFTGKRLNGLRRSGWYVLHAVQWESGADIDHLVIGPPGVFTVNSKRHPGKQVWYGDRAITVNRAPTRHIAKSEYEAKRTARVLSARCGFAVEVRPVIAVVGAASLKVRNASAPVLVLEGAECGRRLSGLAPRLSVDQVRHVFAVARQRGTWA
jgi:hypothetical protein